MKILHVGVFTDASSTTIQMAHSIKKKNHTVQCFDFRYKKKKKEINRFHKILIDKINNIKLPFFKKIANIHKYYLFGNWKINRQLFHEVKNNKYDIVFLSKANTINYKLISKLNKYTKTWYFFMDPLNNALRVNAHEYAALSTWSSATFTSVNAFFRREGANSFFITEGYNPKIFNPGKGVINKTIDVIFVGSISPKRKNYISFLKENDIYIVSFGPGWENESIYINELADKYRTAKIILNFTRGNIGFSDRVFHALGSKSLLISEYCNDFERFFKKGVHLEWFKSPEELLELVKFYLTNDTSREKIAEHGHKYVIKNFTWEQIIVKIFDIIHKEKKNQKSTEIL